MVTPMADLKLISELRTIRLEIAQLKQLIEKIAEKLEVQKAE